MPDDNPTFPSEPDSKRGEIFAVGFRNPFRFTIDPVTGELLVGDVGSVYIEELDFSAGGENFGWPKFEGDRVVYGDARLIPPNPIFPAYQYDNIPPLCVVIPLLSYRQRHFPHDASFPTRYDGTHFFADFCDGPILNLRQGGDGKWEAEPFATGFVWPVDGALGSDGSFYVLEYGRALKRIWYQAAGS